MNRKTKLTLIFRNIIHYSMEYLLHDINSTAIATLFEVRGIRRIANIPDALVRSASIKYSLNEEEADSLYVLSISAIEKNIKTLVIRSRKTKAIIESKVVVELRTKDSPTLISIGTEDIDISSVTKLNPSSLIMLGDADDPSVGGWMGEDYLSKAYTRHGNSQGSRCNYIPKH